VKRVFNAISSIGSYCPYTLLFKKAVRLIRGGPVVDKAKLNERERDLLFRIKMGQGIALVGFICLTFWIPFFPV
jgi:hypothetical protein